MTERRESASRSSRAASLGRSARAILSVGSTLTPPPDLSPSEPSKRLSFSFPTDRRPSRPGLEHLSYARRPAAFLCSSTTLRRPAPRFRGSADAVPIPIHMSEHYTVRLPELPRVAVPR